MADPTLTSAVGKLRRYGTARNRDFDREPRTVVITDDEAIALLRAIGEYETIVSTHHFVGDDVQSCSAGIGGGELCGEPRSQHVFAGHRRR